MTAQKRLPSVGTIVVPSAAPDTMSLDEAAAYIRLGRDSLHELVDRGEIAATSLNQKHMVFRRVTLDEYLVRMERLQQAERQARYAVQMQAANDAPGSHRKTRGRRRRQLPVLPETGSEV